MLISVPRELRPGERRVAATPETVARLVKLGFEVAIEKGAGERAAFLDSDYTKAGARIVDDPKKIWSEGDVVLKVQPPEDSEADQVRDKGTLICFLWPAKNGALIDRLATRKATVIAMDQIPRITRAQKFDALSSMANIAGYRAIIEAASFFGRFFTGQMTAAGKVQPARVLVIGAGVAGLSAIGAARGLGASVRAFDTRPEVKEQITSMGADFLGLEFQEDARGEGGYAKQMSDAFLAAEVKLFSEQAPETDIIVTTALIPGKPAPILLPTSTVESMRPGSVIVDLAAEFGGNCGVTRPGEVVEHKGVTVIGYIDLPSRLAPTASQLYGSNLVHLVADMGGAKSWHVNLEDEVVRGALVLLEGKKMWPPPKKETPPVVAVKPPPSTTPPPSSRDVAAAAKAADTGGHPAVHGGAKKGEGAEQSQSSAVVVLLLAAGLVALGAVVPAGFLSHFTVFVLACFIGWQVVWNVTAALHTPLMSVTNAISGIILVGGMLQIGASADSAATILGAIAVLIATINVAGGFLVTQRMLQMFRR